MKNIFKRNRKTEQREVVVHYKWAGTYDADVKRMNSSGLAALKADPRIEIITIVALD
jgi:hypothetical protein